MDLSRPYAIHFDFDLDVGPLWLQVVGAGPQPAKAAGVRAEFRLGARDASVAPTPPRGDVHRHAPIVQHPDDDDR